MYAFENRMLLPLVLIDVSPIRSDRRQATPSDQDEGVTPRATRRSRVASRVRANVVRLVPGATRLPFEAAAR